MTEQSEPKVNMSIRGLNLMQSTAIQELLEAFGSDARVVSHEDSGTKRPEKTSTEFRGDIQKFNTMYRLPLATYPTFSELGETVDSRLVKFRKTILKEIDECDLILKMPDNNPQLAIDKMVEIADWLGDIQVYAASEMAKFGLDNDDVLEIIMRSNFSKQNPDGSTTYDEDGKVQKGPNYYKPEPEIREYIIRSIEHFANTQIHAQQWVDPADHRISHARDGRQITTKVELMITHDKDSKNLEDLVAQRAYTIDKVTDVQICAKADSEVSQSQ